MAAARREVDRPIPGSIVDNPDYCSCVNEANFDRVLDLLDDAAANGIRGIRWSGRWMLPDRASRRSRPPSCARRR